MRLSVSSLNSSLTYWSASYDRKSPILRYDFVVLEGLDCLFLFEHQQKIISHLIQINIIEN